jgi:hypothetical protein
VLSGSAAVLVTNPPPPPLSLAFIVSLEMNHQGDLIKLVAPVWIPLLAEIARDPDALLRMTPRQFEELVAAAHDADGSRRGDSNAPKRRPRTGRDRNLQGTLQVQPLGS